MRGKDTAEKIQSAKGILFFLWMAALLLAAACSCRNGRAQHNAPASGGRTATAGIPDSTSDSLRIDSLFGRIWERELAVAADPRNPALARRLAAEALDTVENCLYVVGAAVLDTARPRGREMAARYAAEQWALYCKRWAAGETCAYGPPAAGKVYYAQKVRTRISGDTLFQLYGVPAGSAAAKSSGE